MDYQQYTVIGRLTRDPEFRAFGERKVAKFGLATSGERKRDEATGQWGDIPLFLDCEAWQGEKGLKTADLMEKYCRKGTEVFIVGRFKMETWTDKNTNQKRQAIKLVVTELRLIGAKGDGNGGSGGTRSRTPPAAPDDAGGGYGAGDSPDDVIPF